MESVIIPTTTTPSTKNSSPRGSSFTPVEDEAIAKAWVAASEDPIVGTEQKGNDFFSKIQALYNDTFKPTNREDRSMLSVKTRCKAIHKECMLFSGCHARITRAHPTGVSPTDILNLATALYNGVEVQNVEDDCGKPFKYLRAWNTLRRHQKFLVAQEKPTSVSVEKGSTDQSDNSDATPVATDVATGNEQHSVCMSPSEQRPMGRKRSKEQKLKQDATDKKLRLAAQSVAAQKERNETLKRHYEIMLFTNAPADCDNSEAVEYFKIMRTRALSRLRREEVEQGDGSAVTEGQEAPSNNE